MKSNENIRDLLLPEFGGRVGVETCRALTDVVKLYRDQYGSYRFTLTNYNGQVLSALQVMTKPPHIHIGRVCNVYTHPEHRRRGYARHLLTQAQLFFEVLEYSDDRSEDGAAWLAAATKFS